MARFLLEVALRAALVATAAASILSVLRVRPPALRHTVWTIVLAVMLALPVWSAVGPTIRLSVLPAGGTSRNVGSPDDETAKSGASRTSVTGFTPPLTVEPAPEVSAARPGMLVLLAVYLLGVMVLLARLLVGTVQAHRLRRAAVVRAGHATSARCATPVTVGWLSPTLILPEGWERWPAAHLDAVVVHEHAHARRYDPLVQWFALLNRAIFWFHPLAWWLERKLASLAEEVCDLAVIRAGHSPQDYSGYLIDMARALSRQGRRLNVVAMAMPGNNLAVRMRRIFEGLPMTPLTRARIVCTWALCLLSSIVLAAGVLVPRSSAAAGPRAAADAQIVPLAAGGTVPSPQPPDDAVQRRGASAPDEIAQLERVVRSKAGADANAGTGAQSPNAEPPRADSQPSVREEPARVTVTDLSGHWSLVSATYAGRGRGGSGEGGVERPVTTRWTSGAPVNCGPECTIIQTAETLTVSRLGTPDAVTPYDNGEVVLNLDGSDSTVTQSGGSHYVVHAKWDGDRLVVTYDSTHFTVTQVLSIDNGMLKVVTSFSVGDAPVTFTYAKG